MTIDTPITLNSVAQQEQPIDIVYRELCDHLVGTVEHLFKTLSKYCESPIEVMLGAVILAHDNPPPGERPLILIPDAKTSILLNQKPDQPYTSYRALVPQYIWNKYRIDFAYLDGMAKVFIECDGHQFHEKTPEQAGRDKEKDRAAQIAGIPILRFTGSQIYKDPCGCAEDIFDCVINEWGKQCQALR